ncbi:MAG: hypothetical protein C4526_04920 [Nitrospiraceae bacterium]|nr:MAG: hypothetical protein C4526_04920 [Nitrospiraceae bacterium]
MKRAKRNSRINGIYIYALIVAFVVSMGASYFYLKGKFSFDSSFINELESRQAEDARKGQKKDTPMLYERQETALPAGGGEEAGMHASAEDAVRKYLQAYGVRLLDLYVDNEGVVYVDLGDELKKNFRGDAAAELNIIAGLYKSIEPAVPGFIALKILIEGHEAETLGGHIDISKPLRKEIAENT